MRAENGSLPRQRYALTPLPTAEGNGERPTADDQWWGAGAHGLSPVAMYAGAFGANGNSRSPIPVPQSPFPNPRSPIPIPYSLFPIPYPLSPIPYSGTTRRSAAWAVYGGRRSSSFSVLSSSTPSGAFVSVRPHTCPSCPAGTCTSAVYTVFFPV
jgi:hypothetical protein